MSKRMKESALNTQTTMEVEVPSLMGYAESADISTATGIEALITVPKSTTAIHISTKIKRHG